MTDAPTRVPKVGDRVFLNIYGTWRPAIVVTVDPYDDGDNPPMLDVAYFEPHPNSWIGCVYGTEPTYQWQWEIPL